MDKFKNFLAGILVGLANITPGLCSATVAIVIGVYDQIVIALSLDFRYIKQHFWSLMCTALGIAIGIFGFSFLIDYLMTNFEISSTYFFLGLLLGTTPVLVTRARKIAEDTPHAWLKYVVFAVFFAIIASLIFIHPEQSAVFNKLTLKTAGLLFLGGILGAVAVILPGLSGSFLLLMLGVYTSIISAIKTLNILFILPFAFGMVFGLVFGAKMMKALLKRYPKLTYFGIIGMVFGSVVSVFPGFRTGWGIVLDVVLLVLGFGIAYILSKNKTAESIENDELLNQNNDDTM